MEHKLATHSQLFFLRLLARFPFWLLYLLSDVLYYAVYYVFSYRKRVVFENLKNAFPEKTSGEQKVIAKKFYRHFCDLTLETIKMATMSDEQMKNKVLAANPEVLVPFYEAGRSVIILSMHYNNWEWTVYVSTYLRHQPLAVYKPLHNRDFDAYMNNNRSRFGAELVKNSDVLRRMITAKQKNEPVFLWLAGDQTPPEFHKTWFRFLNQDTLFYRGPALLAKRFDLPVFFQNVEKKRRGVYKTTFELLIDAPQQRSENEIIKTYIRKMEAVIRENPEFYLWSHKRWKHQRPENTPLQ